MIARPVAEARLARTIGNASGYSPPLAAVVADIVMGYVDGAGLRLCDRGTAGAAPLADRGAFALVAVAIRVRGRLEDAPGPAAAAARLAIAGALDALADAIDDAGAWITATIDADAPGDGPEILRQIETALADLRAAGGPR